MSRYGKYSYRRFDDVLDQVAPALDEHGIIVAGEVTHQEKWREDKKLFVTMVKEYTFFAEDGSFVKCSTVGQAFDVGDKAATESQTVAYRIGFRDEDVWEFLTCGCKTGWPVQIQSTLA